MRSILRGERSADQIKQFLLDYNAREASPEELGGFLAAVRDAATKVSCPRMSRHEPSTSSALVVTTAVQ